MTTGTPGRNLAGYGNITAFYGWQCQDPWWGNGTNCVAGWSANLNCASGYAYICKIPFSSYPCMPPPRWVGPGQALLWHGQHWRSIVRSSSSAPPLARWEHKPTRIPHGRSPPPPPPAPPSPPAPPLPPTCERLLRPLAPPGSGCCTLPCCGSQAQPPARRCDGPSVALAWASLAAPALRLLLLSFAPPICKPTGTTPAGAPVHNSKYVTCDNNGTYCYQHGGESNGKTFTNSRLACQALGGDLVWWCACSCCYGAGLHHRPPCGPGLKEQAELDLAAACPNNALTCPAAAAAGTRTRSRCAHPALLPGWPLAGNSVAVLVVWAMLRPH
jgi:hypothetical protein